MIGIMSEDPRVVKNKRVFKKKKWDLIYELFISIFSIIY